MKIIYRAFDGSEFTNARDCEEHEKNNPLNSKEFREARLLASELKATGKAAIARAAAPNLVSVSAVDLIRMHDAFVNLATEMSRLFHKNGG